jgi:cell fate regulator YaaT (PSP1 superfamily)
MVFAIGIKFDPDSFPKFYRAPSGPIEENDFCLVRDGEEGSEVERIGYVACFEGRCAWHAERLRPIDRMATAEEVDQWHRLCRRRREALVTARGKVVEHGLPMKIISVTFNDDQNIVLFNFTADHRIDFRELVRDLAGVFKARIELWQIGSRQGAAEKGGFGHCGQALCCAQWMKTFPPISIRQARDQDINHAPPKLSGLCGRLRCCLKYEHDTYCKLRHGAPPVGAQVRDSSEREGTIVDRNLLTQTALVQFDKTRQEWLAFCRLKVLGGGPHGCGKEEKEEPVGVAEEEDVPVAGNEE